MAAYFTKIDFVEGIYKPSQAVIEKTHAFGTQQDYELGYWMRSFIRLFSPGIYFRVRDAFGEVSNYAELRYLMEHATFDPEHPLYNLDYEECATEDRRRLDTFREIALGFCFCWYWIVKRDRPDLLPKAERKPLTKKEEKYLRWMQAYYAHSGTAQERAAYNRLYWEKRDMFPRREPTAEEVTAFDNYIAEINRRMKQERRLEAQRRETERLNKLPEKVYIAAHDCIKKQFRVVFGKDNQFVVIRNQFESGDFEYAGRLPSTRELVVVLGQDIRSRFLLRYIATRFHGDVSVIQIDGENERCFPLSFNNSELEESCKHPVRLSKGQLRELRQDFERLKASGYTYFIERGSEICGLLEEDLREYILKIFPEGENMLSDILGRCMGYAPEGWPRSGSFYYYCIEDMIEDGTLVVTHDEESPNGKFVSLRMMLCKNSFLANEAKRVLNVLKDSETNDEKDV